MSLRAWTVALAWVALALLLAVLLWRSWEGPDVFYHLALGRDVVASRSAQPADRVLLAQPSFRNVYWLFQVTIHGLWSVAGARGVSVLFGILWFAIATLWVATSGADRHPMVGLPLTLAALLVFQQRFDLRPEVASYLLLMVQMARLVCWRPGRDPWLATATLFALTEALWVNVHGYFVLGPAVVAARLAAAAAHREGAKAVRRLVALLAVTTAASLASPFGIGAWQFVGVLSGFLRDMRSEIAEFSPPAGVFLTLWTVRLFWLLWALTLLAAIWLFAKRRLMVFPALLAAAGLGLSASAIRNLPLLMLLSGPLWRDTLTESAARVAASTPIGRRTRLASLVASVTTVVALACSAWVVSGGFYASLRSETRFGVAPPPHVYPVRAAGYLKSHGAHGRIFNSSADGGYLELAFPDLLVCMDSRYVEAVVVRRYFAALADPAAFSRLDADLRFDAALLKVVDSGPLAVALLRDPGWILVWADLHRALWARAGSPTAEEWPPAGLHLDEGDDLAEPVNGLAAIQWTAIGIEAGERELLLLVLDQLGRAPRIPSFVVQYALQYGLATDDDEVIDRGHAMAPRSLALTPEHAAAVQRLLDAATRQGPRPRPLGDSGG